MNPYQVLGVSEDATDEEIRSAYIALVKKYHPDKYQDNPLKNLADEKLKEINEAYDQIGRERAHNPSNGTGNAGARSGGTGAGGYNYGNYGNYGKSGNYGTGAGHGYSSGGYGGTNSSYSGEYATEFARVRKCLNSNSLHEARAILDAIPARNAEWNFLYGIMLFRSGDFSAAKGYLEMAVNLDPANAEYRQAYNTLASRGTRSYHTYGNADSSGSMSSFCNCCSALICADSCCECFGGDIVPCC